MKIIEGDITKVPLGPHDYIGHQCNCKTTRGKGLSKTIFDAYKAADIYADGTERRPGRAIVRGHVVNLMGQLYPGPPMAQSRYSNDSSAKRQAWFKEALADLSALGLDIATLYLPYKIGCGLARGSWPVYLAMLEEWSSAQPFDVVLVKYKP